MTNSNSKILPVALVAALLGGSVGAFVMRPSKHTDTTDVASQTAPATTQSNLTATPNAADQTLAADATTNEVAANNEANLSPVEREAYRAGFTDGVNAVRDNRTTTVVNRETVVPGASRVVYRPATRTRYARSSGTRRAYYDYGQQRSSRSFWQKHRDKLTVAAGTGGGALLGGLIGGKKGAAIGALSGAGGSALYTYKIRKRNRRY